MPSIRNTKYTLRRELARTAGEDDRAVAEHVAAVDHAERDADVLFDEQHCNVALVGERSVTGRLHIVSTLRARS
jgi:hypothetical protein